MRRKLFKIAYKLHLYKIAKKISPSLFFYERLKEFAEVFGKVAKEVKEVKAEPEE